MSKEYEKLAKQLGTDNKPIFDNYSELSKQADKMRKEI